MNLPSLKIGNVTAKLPIIQGGMGVGISLHKLASAVAAEGGIGVIAGAMIGMREKDIAKNPVAANSRALEKEINQAKEITNGVLGVNIMVVLTDFASLVKTAVSSKADIIFSGAGLPLDLPKYFLEVCEEKKQDMKTALVPIVSSSRAAAIICKKWLSRFGKLPDAFVVEGPKAGGHLGFKPEDLDNETYALEKIIPELLNVTKEYEDKSGKAIPIIAAGGVYSGHDIHSLIRLGASGVQMGTRFVATEECDADIRFKEAFVNATEKDLAIIKSPVGLPGRALRSKFVDFVESKRNKFKCLFHCITTCDQEKSPYCIAAALLNAMKGNLEKGFAFSGITAPKITSIVTVKELIKNLQMEFEEAANSFLKNK